MPDQPPKQQGIYPRHFGLIFLSQTEWQALADRAKAKRLTFYQQPRVRFPGTRIEHRTFFLEDPINGDQIRQKEIRDIFGLNTELKKAFNNNTDFKAGVGFRNDIVDDVELSRSLNREETLESLQLGDVNETNFYAYADAEFTFGKFTINPALRLDYFKFGYVDKLAETYENQSQDKAFVSPKLNFLYNPSNELQLYLKSGIGFHSNDSRVILQQEANDILPAAYGTDLGFIWKPFPKLLVNSALWYLFLEQEFVYVGDAGIVEPSGRSRRMGVD
ncbi:MAG: TonB-dependent receptor, partial [Nitrospiraceae bacterium]|nr:TonB-dependent receptor [Nitrospiraceae bacterium]